MQTILLLVHVVAAIGMVGLILMQHGKGADAGAAFGSGASATVFGSQGSTSFVSRLTGGLATVFFITSLSLAYFAGHKEEVSTSVVDRVQAEQKSEIPLPVDEKLFDQSQMNSGIPLPQNGEEVAPLMPSGDALPAVPEGEVEKLKEMVDSVSEEKK
ncbi:MAG: preprotein translocase subunit SecG [Gammaproteobacteria bacterium]|jgi:preprotein translocase subunit SecG|nr:preprotein translocase subunit SecG [Gammaproteobacteria bacterium]MBT3488359.1 preprotein translocase subunit SecG [Gammaproteobacteria bacterium]MBT3719450.1 preprotein translocase subunit SecG [Gammaproteobacteria bacterium]MBT3845607.1 preprotein translocase subunit SecG [Gammaproteobacteria bacterium]MBT3894137.1 preprotein translocase subunit SecG [Gammaproteobacteria bacterium]